MQKYAVNEIFYSIQGEGVRAGIPHVFLRFSGCNLQCNKLEHGFDCDTEFVSHRHRTAQEIVDEMRDASTTNNKRPWRPWVLLTGGEPALQLDEDLVEGLKLEHYRIAIETNGTFNLDKFKLDWICVSPKSAEHTIRQPIADEVKYVRAYGQGIPKPSIDAVYKLISPAFEGSEFNLKNYQWCVDLVKDNPEWRLSLQTHKFGGIR